MGGTAAGKGRQGRQAGRQRGQGKGRQGGQAGKASGQGRAAHQVGEQDAGDGGHGPPPVGQLALAVVLEHLLLGRARENISVRSWAMMTADLEVLVSGSA